MSRRSEDIWSLGISSSSLRSATPSPSWRRHELAAYLTAGIRIAVDVHVIQPGHEIAGLGVGQCCRASERTGQVWRVSRAVRSTLALTALAAIVRNPKNESCVAPRCGRAMNVSRGGRTAKAGITTAPRQLLGGGF